MSVEYDNYIHDHIENLKHGLEWMQQNLVGLDGDAITEAVLNADQHDASKWTTDEYPAYDAYFYGGNKTYEVRNNFDKAWLHHIHNNPHHWQHWVLLEDDPNIGSIGKALEMPLKYVYEMIADWWTFSWRNNNLLEMFSWYQSHRDHMMLNVKTRIIVERILHDIYTVLSMQMKFEHPETEIIAPEFLRTALYIPVESPYKYGIEQTGEVIEHSDKETEDAKYGVPEQKKFPLPDADHVKSAIRFFNYVDPKYESELAAAILARAKEYGVKIGEDIEVGDENRFKNYLPKKEEKD